FIPNSYYEVYSLRQLLNCGFDTNIGILNNSLISLRVLEISDPDKQGFGINIGRFRLFYILLFIYESNCQFIVIHFATFLLQLLLDPTYFVLTYNQTQKKALSKAIGKNIAFLPTVIATPSRKILI
ncbi:hypothetical protein L9F63_021577, partial [Diploptera punctata]